MPLFELANGPARQLKANRFGLERELQRSCEANLELFFGVRFIDTEFSTGGRQPGRIDTLGLDQDASPTIIEYKRSQKDNVINQGLFYLDWLVDHKGDFIVAAQTKLGKTIEIDWNHPRLILVAEEFTDYDKYAVNRIGANIELWTYRVYEGHLLFLEPIHATRSQKPRPVADKTNQDNILPTPSPTIEKPQYEISYHTKRKPQAIVDLFNALREAILALGGSDEEIVETVNKLYIGYRYGKNFAEIQIQSQQLKIFLDIPVAELNDPHDIARDVANVGHWGTGETEVKLQSHEELGYVVSLIEQAYFHVL
jgi:predicted transport protein